jgi:hypothetical protein
LVFEAAATELGLAEARAEVTAEAAAADTEETDPEAADDTDEAEGEAEPAAAEAEEAEGDWVGWTEDDPLSPVLSLLLELEGEGLV